MDSYQFSCSPLKCFLETPPHLFPLSIGWKSVATTSCRKGWNIVTKIKITLDLFRYKGNSCVWTAASRCLKTVGHIIQTSK